MSWAFDDAISIVRTPNGSKSYTSCPSIITTAFTLSVFSNVILKSTGNTNGRWVKECAEIGVTINASVRGYTTGPLHDKLYAVEPVGVETMSPSPWYLLKSWLLVLVVH